MDKLKYILLLLITQTYSQNSLDTIKKNAIEITNLTMPNQNIYCLLKKYKCICVGEFHGTKEPSEFLTGLAKTFLANNKKILIGFEIQKSTLLNFPSQNDTNSLSKTIFFNQKRMDGKNSKAWFKAISELNKLNVKFCFFDEGLGDSVMSKNLINCYKEDTSFVILTLSGNLHNKLLPYKNSKTMGTYLKTFFGDNIFSVNHIFEKGTMYNLTSEGLKIHSLPDKKTNFSLATNYINYFISNTFNKTNGYSGYLFTKEINASLPMEFE